MVPGRCAKALGAHARNTTGVAKTLTTIDKLRDARLVDLLMTNVSFLYVDFRARLTFYFRGLARAISSVVLSRRRIVVVSIVKDLGRSRPDRSFGLIPAAANASCEWGRLPAWAYIFALLPRFRSERSVERAGVLVRFKSVENDSLSDTASPFLGLLRSVVRQRRMRRRRLDAVSALPFAFRRFGVVAKTVSVLSEFSHSDEILAVPQRTAVVSKGIDAFSFALSFRMIQDRTLFEVVELDVIERFAQVVQERESCGRRRPLWAGRCSRVGARSVAIGSSIVSAGSAALFD